jgi:hypothetical protein
MPPIDDVTHIPLPETRTEAGEALARGRGSLSGARHRRRLQTTIGVTAPSTVSTAPLT